MQLLDKLAWGTIQSMGRWQVSKLVWHWLVIKRNIYGYTLAHCSSHLNISSTPAWHISEDLNCMIEPTNCICSDASSKRFEAWFCLRGHNVLRQNQEAVLWLLLRRISLETPSDRWVLRTIDSDDDRRTPNVLLGSGRADRSTSHLVRLVMLKTPSAIGYRI